MLYEYVMTHFSQTAIEMMLWLSAACAVFTVVSFLVTVSVCVTSWVKGKANREHK